jgi:hypothetical protein
MSEYWYFLQWLARRMFGRIADPESGLLTAPWRRQRRFTVRRGHLVGWAGGVIWWVWCPVFTLMWTIDTQQQLLALTMAFGVLWLVSCAGTSLSIELANYRREQKQVLDSLKHQQ